ncbi:MAG: hypothetical protein RR198_07595 [Oscillospiraceae bacterium]
MVLDLVDKEGTKSGKGLGWSWFGLNDGKRDAKILRELGEIYKEDGDYVDIFNKKNPQTPINKAFVDNF